MVAWVTLIEATCVAAQKAWRASSVTRQVSIAGVTRFDPGAIYRDNGTSVRTIYFLNLWELYM